MRAHALPTVATLILEVHTGCLKQQDMHPFMYGIGMSPVDVDLSDWARRDQQPASSMHL